MLHEATDVPRGVHRPRWLTADGHPYLMAVTSDNRCIVRARIYPWDDVDELAAVLWRHLNREDPQPGAVYG